MTETAIPFHAGEIEAQQRAGAGDVASWAAGFIRDYMPEQHRDFYTLLPFLVVSAADDENRTWVTILEGSNGFIRSPDPRTLTVNTELDPKDPLSGSLKTGTNIGVLGIELATRRRNRLSGVFRRDRTGYNIDIIQTFGNCPQYIQEREWRRVRRADQTTAVQSKSLNVGQMARIDAADTLFIGTGHSGVGDHASYGYDASHRGGAPGFVQILDATRLRIPDYAGNNFYNTIGNILANPRVGLLFVDFETGGMLQITGRAQIDWAPTDAKDNATRRMIDIAIDGVVDRPNALSLRWSSEASPTRHFSVTRKVAEAKDIISFYLVPSDGKQIERFEAGQYLPIELNVPGEAGKVRRSYSLSGSPKRNEYRLTIKREPLGVASRYLHDHVSVGGLVATRRPAGDFVISCSHCPLVLASVGVGLTPLLSMLHAAAEEPSNRPVWFVHGARNGDHDALAREVDELVKARPNLSKHVLYSQPGDNDRLGIDHNEVGRVSAQTLLNLAAGADAHYMLCGPSHFVSEVRLGLETAGVSSENIRSETFG